MTSPDFQDLLQEKSAVFNSAPDPYRKKFALYPPLIAHPPDPDLALSVVIPCREEPDLHWVLEDLFSGARPVRPAEIIVVINGSEADGPAPRSMNLATFEDNLSRFADRYDPKLPLHLLHLPDLPKKDAGVGLARKIGMDEAAGRFHLVGAARAVIVCLDADCRVDADYLPAIERHFFEEHPETPGCSVHFEHPLDAAVDGRQRAGIVQYELFLRYYRLALEWAGSPHAFFTVGSSMAVTAAAYRKQGGMNRRKAGEDFYFLQKIIDLGGFSTLTTTTVRPSPRVSHRVPFGTGLAMAKWADCDDVDLSVHDPKLFRMVRDVMERIPDWGSSSDLSGLDGVMVSFLEAQGFGDRLAEIRANSSSGKAFRKRFLMWFNGFRILKFLNFASEDAYPKVPVAGATQTFFPVDGSAEEVLLAFRRRDRGE